ncbi:hypothetical protein Gocc_2906 [Gaiella occulta]|uniref:Uncharacterized protein n=1 Tax=Gaiella occulta TaxID=1002870 RepID=A0A7M2YT98_9ACTN|nr:capsid cement protein [Gaiella occulta]RDI73306.1 hypothetical protein Gocc_2906 [Gaiella occulta]
MAVSDGVNPLYTPGAKVTMKVSAAVTAGQLVEVSGSGTIGPAAANSRKVVGVALQTGSAANDLIAVQLLGYIFKLKAAGAITAGDEVSAGAAGTVATQAAAAGATAADINNARSVIGVALENIADTVTGPILVGRA